MNKYASVRLPVDVAELVVREIYEKLTKEGGYSDEQVAAFFDECIAHSSLEKTAADADLSFDKPIQTVLGLSKEAMVGKMWQGAKALGPKAWNAITSLGKKAPQATQAATTPAAQAATKPGLWNKFVKGYSRVMRDPLARGTALAAPTVGGSYLVGSHLLNKGQGIADQISSDRQAGQEMFQQLPEAANRAGAEAVKGGIDEIWNKVKPYMPHIISGLAGVGIGGMAGGLPGAILGGLGGGLGGGYLWNKLQNKQDPVISNLESVYKGFTDGLNEQNPDKKTQTTVTPGQGAGAAVVPAADVKAEAEKTLNQATGQ